MFNHVMVGASDIEHARKFYDAVLGVIGVAAGTANTSSDGHLRYFYRHDGSTFGVTQPINGQPATAANGGTIGFRCASAEQVIAFSDAAVSNGGIVIETPPVIREGAVCIAYLRDPTGNKICALYRP